MTYYKRRTTYNLTAVEVRPWVYNYIPLINVDVIIQSASASSLSHQFNQDFLELHKYINFEIR